MAKEVKLSQGLVALVDDEDFDAVMQFKWCALRAIRRCGPDKWYAIRSINYRDEQGNKRCRNQLLHRFLMPGVEEVDHKDRDGLNNQRCNLRPATRSQNLANRVKVPGGTSRFLGVHWNRKDQKWRSGITVNGKTYSLGNFTSEESAARARDAVAKTYLANFATLNFPLEGSPPMD